MVFLHIDTQNYNKKGETGETPIQTLNKFIRTGKNIFALIYMEGCGPCNATRPEWKKIGNVLQKDLVDILQGEIRKNGISNLVISVSKVIVTTDLSIAKVFLSVFPQDRASELLAAIKTNAPLIKHDLSQRVKLQLRKVPNLSFYIDDSLDYIEKIDNALSEKENPIENRALLEKRKKF